VSRHGRRGLLRVLCHPELDNVFRLQDPGEAAEDTGQGQMITEIAQDGEVWCFRVRAADGKGNSHLIDYKPCGHFCRAFGPRCCECFRSPIGHKPIDRSFVCGVCHARTR
jgi:hypothetical protein